MNALEFVAREALALDHADYEAWQAMFTDNPRYWAPYDWSAEAPDDTTNIIYDDRPRLELRLKRLLGGDVHSQDPFSRTVRVLGQPIPAEPPSWQPPDGADEVLTVPFFLTERRRKTSTQYTGRFTYWLRKVDGSYRMSAKRIQVMESDGPLGNLTFIL